jgi:DNA-binding CsgD family transcriptional regulator
VLAVLSDRGRITYCQDDAPDVWPALVDGRASIVARSVGMREEYLIIENSPAVRPARALSPGEAETLRLASQGMSNKLMAYGLGISSTAVSRHLASATNKLGLASRSELIRVAALLVPDDRPETTDALLTSAEREILVLLQRGLSNQEIANVRDRSVRTIANQVASLLRKTGSGSRRELTVRRGIQGADAMPHVAE